MKKFSIRLLVALISFVSGIGIFGIWNSLRSPLPSSPVHQALLNNVGSHLTPVTLHQEPLQRANSIEFFGWWWSDEQMAEKDFRVDNNPPRNAYLKLEIWNTNYAPHPDHIDIVYYLENKSDKTADFILSAVGDFKVESYERVMETTEEDFLSYVLWTGKRVIGKQIIRNLAPGEVRFVKFPNFNLGAMVDKYNQEKYGDLWPWEFRVRIDVRNIDIHRVEKEEAVLQLVPGC